MPELPEVETVVRFIRPYLKGKHIQAVFLPTGFSKVIYTHSLEELNALLSSRRILHVRRRAKFIVLDLDLGHVLIHLRMTGRLLTQLGPDDRSNHITARFDFTDHSRMYLKDFRKFGRIYYHENMTRFDMALGIEPLSSDFTLDWLSKTLHNRQSMMKPLLLDQSIIAGLGNIYADESLWAAKIHPQTVSNRVSTAKTALLHSAIQHILQEAIDQQGTTIINFRFGENETGGFAKALKVFGKDGDPCPRCETTLKKIRVSQRGTHFCPQCQRIRK